MERWPPVYDAEDLIREIKRLTEHADVATAFFEWRRDRSTLQPDDVCQGDIVHLAATIPLIAEDGSPAEQDHPGGMWMVIGNTCDFARARDVAGWTQLVPIVDLGPLAELNGTERDALRKYTHARRFYVPSWSEESATKAHIADFLRPVALDKAAVSVGHVRVEARLNRAAWLLLNGCLVRFLARDDGRYDP